MTVNIILNLLFGIWLMISPEVLGSSDPTADNDYIIGPFIITLSVISFSECMRGINILNILFGAWLCVAPWILGYQNYTGVINDLLVGGIVILNTIASKPETDAKFGGGWASLFK